MKPSPEREPVADKLFYKIGEVSNIVGVKPYVLRYWESEFPFLRPSKNRAGQRVYTRKNIDLILQVKNLLYQEKYTIAGVKRRFREGHQKRNSVSQEAIGRVKKRLREILDTLK